MIWLNQRKLFAPRMIKGTHVATPGEICLTTGWYCLMICRKNPPRKMPEIPLQKVAFLLPSLACRFYRLGQLFRNAKNEIYETDKIILGIGCGIAGF